MKKILLFSALLPLSIFANSSWKMTVKNQNNEILQTFFIQEKNALSIEFKEVSEQNNMIFAYGISSLDDEKILDTDKDNISSASESNLCWAATSANLVAWWQNNYPRQEAFPATLPRDSKAIYNFYRENNLMAKSNSASTFVDGMPWYFNNYLNDFINPSQWRFQFIGSSIVVNAYKISDNFTTLEQLTQEIKENLPKGLMGMAMTISSTNQSGHAVTLWAAELDEVSGLVKAVFITDSDDEKTSIFRYEVSQGEGYVHIEYDWCKRLRNVMTLFPHKD